MFSSGALQKANRFSIHISQDERDPSSLIFPESFQAHITLTFDNEEYVFKNAFLLPLVQRIYQWTLQNTIVSPKNLLEDASPQLCPFGFYWDKEERYYFVFENKEPAHVLKKIGFFDALIPCKIFIEEVCEVFISLGVEGIRPLVESGPTSSLS